MAITKVTSSVLSSGSATDGYVLTADGSGNSAWEAAAGGGVDGIVSSADATAITIDSSENVGIGTGSPVGKLSVTADALNSQFSAATGTSYFYQRFSSDGGNHYLGVSNSAGAGLLSGAGAYSLCLLTEGARNIAFGTNNQNRMMIDSAGNVGIGETSPKAPGGADATTLTVKANFYAQWISTVSGAVANTTTWRNIVREAGVYQIQTTDDAMSGEQTAYEIARTSGSNSINYQRWFAGTSEAMRITANGEFLLNRTGIFGSGNTCTAFIEGKSTAAMYVIGTNTSGYQLITFFNGGLNVMGSITHNNSTVTYGGSSDYRLKENVNYDFDATTRLKQLKPARFNWIADSDNIVQDGFLAHEVQDIVPEAVVGAKDATETVSNVVLNTEGNVVAQDITEEEWTAGKEDSTYDADTTWEASHTKIIQQNLDPAKLVPLLVKTIQELEARITTLENA